MRGRSAHPGLALQAKKQPRCRRGKGAHILFEGFADRRHRPVICEACRQGVALAAGTRQGGDSRPCARLRVHLPERPGRVTPMNCICIARDTEYRNVKVASYFSSLYLRRLVALLEPCRLRQGRCNPRVPLALGSGTLNQLDLVRSPHAASRSGSDTSKPDRDSGRPSSPGVQMVSRGFPTFCS